MNIALIDVKGSDNRSIKGSIAMNIRNMVVLSEYLGGDFFYNAQQLKRNKKQYDVLIFGFGGISSNIQEVRDFAKTQEDCRVYWLKTEYDSSVNPSLHYFYKETGIKYETIQNIEPFGELPKQCKGFNFLNLNLLITRAPNPITKKKYDCVYYSRWRPNRAKYLKRYLQGDIYFSSDNKNFKQHKHIGCNPRYIKKLNWKIKSETLNNFRYSLYMEDEYTHKHFNCLANRWYEAGICNNVVFFDRSCLNTIKKSEIGQFLKEVEFYIVGSHEELQNKINECNKDFNKHLSIQKGWRKDELKLRADVLSTLKDIING